MPRGTRQRIRSISQSLRREARLRQDAHRIHRKFRDATMVPPPAYRDNLVLAGRVPIDSGDWVIECGTWKGGMAAGLINMTEGRCNYAFFDSFSGLPPAEECDGARALSWQSGATGLDTYDNCTASISEFMEVMGSATAVSGQMEVHQGLFDETLPTFEGGPIAVLRLDADWYASTLACLDNLFMRVKPGGLVLIDDYGYWDGCTRAVHDFLSRESRPEAIRHSTPAKVAYLVKEG